MKRTQMILYYIFLLFQAGYSQLKDSSYLVLNTSRIYYEQCGKGEALVFVHAGMMDHRMWQKQVPFFSKKYKVVVYDQRGHGLTGNGDSAYFECNGLKAILDKLNISKATFIGISLGACTVTDLAIRYPKIVKKLILVSPGLNGWEWTKDTVIKHYEQMSDAAYKQNDTGSLIEYFIRSWVDGPMRRPGEVEAPVRLFAGQLVKENTKKHFTDAGPLFLTPPAIGLLKKIKAKCLIIWGGKDALDIRQIANLLHKNISTSSQYVFPDAGHLIPLEKPLDFNRIVMRFLKE